MIINPLRKKIIENNLFLEYEVDYSQTRELLWYNIDAKYSEFVTDLLDGPLVALLIPAMALGEDIYINGSISERLFYNLSDSAQILLKEIIPSLILIKLFPNKLENRSVRSPGVATGFSCGVDSFSTLADNYYSEVPKGFKITHILFNNVGSHGKGNEQLFKERYEKNSEVARKIGLPFIIINSNLDKFYNNFTFQQTVTPRNVSVPLILQGGIGRFLVSSAISYKDIKVERMPAIARIDTILLPLLSTEVVDIISAGSEYTRVEKTLRVAEIKDSYDSLDVCVDPKSAGNCSKCWKCIRTMLTLDIAGILDRYSNVFDISIYKKEKTKYIGRILFSDDPLEKEIFQFSKEQDYKLPNKSYASGIYYVVLKKIKNMEKLIWKSINRTKRILLSLLQLNRTNYS